jgi:hypothetical protein
MERLTEMPFDVVADALQRGLDICLVATCHDVIWNASELELEQIDEYLGAVLSAELEQGNTNPVTDHGERLECLQAVLGE